MFHENIPQELAFGNKSAPLGFICMYCTEELLYLRGVCMIWSIRNYMPPRHLHNHPRHSLLLALTNDRRLGKTRHLYWDIWQGHNLCPLKRRSTHTGSFVCLCQAELRVEISLPQPLTSASCFLFPWPPLRPSCPSLVGQTETDPVLIVVVMLLQRGAVSKPTLNQTLNDQALRRPDRVACPIQDRSSAPRGASMGTRARTKKTVSFSKIPAGILMVSLIWSWVSN